MSSVYERAGNGALSPPADRAVHLAQLWEDNLATHIIKSLKSFDLLIPSLERS